MRGSQAGHMHGGSGVREHVHGEVGALEGEKRLWDFHLTSRR